MSRFLNSRYSALEAYVPGEQPQDKAYIKLNTNELPYPPSPEVLAALGKGALEELRLYSDPACGRLREKLASFYGCKKECVFVSNGSDDILNFAFMAFGKNGAAFADITYGFYPVFAELNGVAAKIIPLRPDFTIDPRDYYGLNRLVLIANPNAPTGVALPVEEIERVARQNPDGVVLVDEAYVDFGAQSCVKLTRKYDNLIVCMTYSKSRAMAGARLGFAIANPSLIADIDLLKYSTNPYNVNRMTLLCGEAALDSEAYYREKCALVAKTRDAAAKELQEMGFYVLPSKANFLFVKKDGFCGERLYKSLKECGILVRHFKAERIRDFVRITVGTPEDMDILLENIAQTAQGR